MAYGGFEEDRATLKYRCPAAHYGLECAGRGSCPVGASVRIGLEEDRRVFTPLARSSYAWKRAYAKRTAVERVNGRLDVSFGFERHFIRGLPWEAEKNLARLAAQWAEKINKRIMELESQAEALMKEEIATVRTLLAQLPDKAPSLETARNELARMKEGLSGEESCR